MTMKVLSGAKRKTYSQEGRGGTKRARAVKHEGGVCRILNTTQNAPRLWTERRGPGDRNLKWSELTRGRQPFPPGCRPGVRRRPNGGIEPNLFGGFNMLAIEKVLSYWKLDLRVIWLCWGLFLVSV